MLERGPQKRKSSHPYFALTVVAVVCGALFFAPLRCAAEPPNATAPRLVLIKLDGLPYEEVDRFVRETNPRTGKSLLPWIEHIFYQRGTRLTNFYVRGMSLSAPSWSLLDTGQHLQIKGNVEYDRWTLHAYDYLNFIPFYLNNALQRRVDMPGPEALDELGVPLLIDAFPYERRFTSFQLFQRGVRWTTLQRGLQNRVTSRTPLELFDEWVMGFETRRVFQEQAERELLEKLNDPNIRYLDFYDTDFDHAAHHNSDRETHLRSLQRLDAAVGRIWMGVQQSPLAANTITVLVSDHGTNSVNGVYSQGFNMVKLLGGPTGGGHHVITKRRLMLDYSIKGIYPLVSLVTTTTDDSKYLRGESSSYPTAMIDFDGNERVAIHWRDGDLNVLQILLQQLKRPDLAPTTRHAAQDAFFAKLEKRRAVWAEQNDQLAEELGVLRARIERAETVAKAQGKKKWTKADADAGIDKEALRVSARLLNWKAEEVAYREYHGVMANLLALRADSFEPERLKITEVIPPRAMGDGNSLFQLQNYVVGLGARGLVLGADGALDWEQSFERVDYPQLIHSAAVRNNVQKQVRSRPVDFIAMPVAAGALRQTLADAGTPETIEETPVWLYGGEDSQALILSRYDERGRLWFKYAPIARLRQREDGSLDFRVVEPKADLPLKIWEDPRLDVPSADKEVWLGRWHSEEDWLAALHRTAYSNALISLQEQFTQHITPLIDVDAPGIDKQERLLRRFRYRQRRLVEADMLVLANDHWNFDVRGFNPGGNHGSFFRISTHSTLMFAGGAATNIPAGVVVAKPYDSLAFAPTLLTLTGHLKDGKLDRQLVDKGFTTFPGPIISELFSPNPRRLSSDGAAESGGLRR